MATVLDDQRAETLTYPWKVGLAYCGDPGAAGAWSGTPASLGKGLRGKGAAVVALKAQPPRVVETTTAHILTLARLPRVTGTLMQRARLSRTIALYTGHPMSVLRTRAMRGEMRRALPLDAVVQIQTNYEIAPGIPVATFEDMTVAQAVELPYPDWRALSRREKRRAMDRQRRAYARASVCCFTTMWAANSAVADYGVSPEKINVVGVGRNHAPSSVARNWDTPRFLFVGGNWTVKNGDAVLRAFAKVRSVFPNARLDLVGTHPPIEASGVHGHGWLSLDDARQSERLDSLFESATCFVMPSLCDAAGIAYVEAAAAGVPSIGSAIGGSSELIGDGGCVVDPHDDDALVTAMLTFADGDTAREAGRRALARSDRHTWTKVAGRVLAALEPHVLRHT